MGNVLGKKQRVKNSDWIEAFTEIEQVVSRKELDKLVDKIVEEVKKKTKGKNAAYAWSGGKDSLVLGEICRMAGIAPCVLAICDLEYKAFIEWVDAHKPPVGHIQSAGYFLDNLK